MAGQLHQRAQERPRHAALALALTLALAPLLALALTLAPLLALTLALAGARTARTAADQRRACAREYQ